MSTAMQTCFFPHIRATIYHPVKFSTLLHFCTHWPTYCNRLFLSLLFTFCFPFSPFSQRQDITFEHYTQAHGLSSAVTKIAQDREGFLWLATTDGLNRFDGRNFIVYRNIPDDSTSIPNNIINDLNVDLQGRVWIATNGGICYYRFSDDAFERVIFNDTLEKIDRHRVHAVTHGPDGKVWFATKTLIHQWSYGRPVMSFPLPTPHELTIRYLFCDEKNQLWIGTNNGLYNFNPATGRFIHAHITTPFSRERNLTLTIHPILGYVKDTLLMGSWYGGVHKVFLTHETIQTVYLEDQAETSPRKHIVKGICKAKSGSYWVGTYGNGLSVFDPRSSAFTHHYHHDPADRKSLSSEYISDVFTDATGILWIGTSAGLDKYDPMAQKFKSIPIPSSPGEFSIYRLPGAIKEDPHDRDMMWITVSGVGLFRYRPATRTFTLFQADEKKPGSLPDNTVYVIFDDAQGRKWVGMRSGICRFDPAREKFIKVEFPGGAMPQGVHQIIQDRHNRFWFATHSNGIYQWDEKKQVLQAFVYDAANPNSLPDNRVFCILEDHLGNIWVGMQNRGLCRLETSTGRFSFYENAKNTPGSLPDNGVYDLYEDKAHRMWIATENGFGVMYPDDDSIRTFTTRDGLCNNSVFSITPDLQGQLWLATNNGISRFDPEKLTFKNYYVHDGLPTHSIAGSAYCGSDGTLYFGSTGMISYCRPEDMSLNTYVPPVVITQFKIFDQPVPVKRTNGDLDQIHLHYRENMITFDFTALNFTNAALNQYAYRLEGFDDKWIYCGNKQSATFTNLDGGMYTFRVIAANNDGIWNEEGASVTLIVHPPFWRTWWFYLLCTISAAGILYAIYRFRIRQLMALQQIRMGISRDLHDEIGSTLSSIHLISSMGSRARPEEKKTLDMFSTIASASSQAMEHMSDIVWSINPRHDAMEMIVARMRQFASETLEPLQIGMNMEIDPACYSISLPVEKRKNFYLIFKEGITNLAKYSKAGMAKISLAVEGRMLVLIIEDDGIGFNPDLAYSGNGLKNMKARATQLRGEIIILSTVGGSRVKLSIPFTP